MYHKIRITVVSLVAITICLLSSTGTLSYFTDTDAQTNSFTVGNASSALVIYDDITSGTENILDTDDYSPLEDPTNVPFYPKATNDGNIPVYQRFRVVIPIALADVVAIQLPEMDNDCTVTTTSENTCSNEYYTVTYKPSVDAEQVVFAEYYITSNNIIPVGGTTTEWPLTGIRFEGISGVDSSLFTCENSNNNCALGINVYSDVIQTTGFTDALSAFANLAETY